MMLKWMATATLILGSLINSLGFYPAGPIILTLGGVLWLLVAIKWREPSMIITNTVMVTAGAGGLLINYIG